MIWAKGFALWNPHQRDIERVPLHQIERLRVATERDGDVLRESPKFSVRRTPFLLRDVLEIYFTHRENLFGTILSAGFLNGRAQDCNYQRLANAEKSHQANFFGNFCFRLSTGSKRSPIFSTRSSV